MSQTKAQLIDTLVASLLPASDSSVDLGSNAVRFANIYGDTLYGSGANLTGLNIVTDTSPQLGGNLASNGNNINIVDSTDGSTNRITFGAGGDLQIYHNGNHSFIEDSGTGALKVLSSNIQLLNAAGNENIIQGTQNGAVELYHDNSLKVSTSAAGAVIQNGHLILNRQDTGNEGGELVFNRASDNANQWFNDVYGSDTSARLRWHNGGVEYLSLTPNTELAAKAGLDIKVASDTGKFLAGIGGDLEIYHNGTRSEIINNTGDLIIQASANNKLMLRAQTGESHLIGYHNAQVELYYDGSKKAETYANGLIAHHHLKVMGAQDQNAVIQMFADEGDNTDDQFLMASEHNPNRWVLLGQYVSGWHRYIQVNPQNGVQLYYDDLDTSSPSAKFATTSTGVAIGGNATFPDGSQAIFGASSDMEIYHIADTTNVIRGQGPITIQTDDTSSGIKLSSYSGGENFAIFKKNGAVELYYDNNKKLETKSNGVQITGNLQCNNTLSCGTGLQQANVASFGGGTSNQINIFDGSNTGWGLLLTQSQGNNTAGSYHYSTNSSVNKPCAIVNVNNDALHFATNNTPRFRIEHDGHVLPSADNAYDLGSTGFAWRNIFTHDLNLSNEGGANDVDGTWGSYTIQEGEESLFLINRRNGKKYKFALTEVS